jgi:hypothetical protein
MPPQLNLLFLCNPAEQYTLFTSALAAAGFRLLIAHHEERAKRILLTRSVDAIVIHHDGINESSPITSMLKRAAPSAPIFRFGDEKCGPQAGIEAICHADLQDEVLASAVAIFFRQWLRPPRLASAVRLRGENVPAPLAAVRAWPSA